MSFNYRSYTQSRIMNNSTFLKEIKVNDQDSYFILATMSDQAITFVVCKGLQVYRGDLDTAEIEKRSSQLSISGNNVQDMILQFFVQNSVADMLVEFTDSDGGRVLKFKKILDGKKNIRAQLCAVELQPSSEAAEDLHRVLHFSVNQLDEKTDSLARSERELREAREELQSALDKMAALVTDKANIEHKLFANFALVLNEKKRKIDELSAQNGTMASEDNAPNDSNSDQD